MTCSAPEKQTLMLCIQSDIGSKWYRVRANNPDDGLTELTNRSLYCFAAGDRLIKSKLISDTNTGYKLNE